MMEKSKEGSLGKFIYGCLRIIIILKFRDVHETDLGEISRNNPLARQHNSIYNTVFHRMKIVYKRYLIEKKLNENQRNCVS